jgi:hypothetical protein
MIEVMEVMEAMEASACPLIRTVWKFKSWEKRQHKLPQSKGELRHLHHVHHFHNPPSIK